MVTVMKKVEELVPYDRNAKLHDKKQIKNVATSIRKYGFVQPVVVDKDNVVVIGHCRLLAAKQLKIAEVPCVCVDDLTPDQVDELRIVDNKSNESEWDRELLLEDLPAMDLSEFDFDFGFSLEEEGKKETEEVETPDVDTTGEAQTKLGDVWLLGDHRLMCGDSTDALNVDFLMGGVENVDLVFTDPPYGMGKEIDGVLNDNQNADDLLAFNKQWIPLAFEKLKDTGCFYCWGIDEPLMDIYNEILKPMKKKNELVIRNFITWAKHSAFGINSNEMLSFPRETEKAWFVMKGMDWNNNNAEFFNEKYAPILKYMQDQAQLTGLTPAELTKLTGVQMWSHWFSKSQFTIIPEKHYAKLQEAFPDAFKLDHKELVGLLGEDQSKTVKPYFDNVAEENVGDIGLTDVWRFHQTSEEERRLAGGHATPKPIKLCARAIKASSREGEKVLDLFGGSGSTLIACEQLGRICYMMEMDPRYCDVIVKRWEYYTGRKAVLLNS